jgi:hypothetical protein
VTATNNGRLPQPRIATASPARQAVIWTAGAALAAASIGWLGLRVPPRSQAPTSEKTCIAGTVAVPTDLPTPVAQHFRATLGERPPKIETAVLWGTARMRFAGLWVPLRFQTICVPGRQFARRMEITWFGLPMLAGSDTYGDGEGTLTIGKTAIRGPEIAHGENLVMWAEALLTPTILVADPRLRWEPVDDSATRLFVPFGDEIDQLLFHVNPQTGLIDRVTAERYRRPGQPKAAWKGEYAHYKAFHGVNIPTRLTVTWQRDGHPWSHWNIEGVEYNVDVKKLFPRSVQAVPWCGYAPYGMESKRRWSALRRRRN